MTSYKIVKFNEASGQVEVEYGQNGQRFTVDVPIKDGLYIVGQELADYVAGMAPVWHIERAAQIKTGIANASEIAALVQEPTPVAETPLTEAQIKERANLEMWATYEFEKKVAATLIKFGLLESDPTQIPVSVQ